MASGSSSTSRPSMSPEVRPMDGKALQATDRTVDGDLQLDAKSFLRGQPARPSRRDAGGRQFDDRRRVSTGIRHSTGSGRGHGQAGEGLQRNDARLGVLRARRVERWNTGPKTRIRRRCQSIRRELLWMPRCRPSRMGSPVRSRPRLRTNPSDARHDWCAATDGSPLREPRTQPGGCRGAQTTERAGEASPVRHEGKDHE